VFLINPASAGVLVIECKNANKDEAIALGVDQIRRYHHETPELFVPEQLFTATDAIGFTTEVAWNTVRWNIVNGNSFEQMFNRKLRGIAQMKKKEKVICVNPRHLRSKQTLEAPRTSNHEQNLDRS
jgi:type I restriction enzyme R subunit